MALNLSPIGIGLLAVSATALVWRPLPAGRYLLPLRLLVFSSLAVELAGLLMAWNGVRNIWLYDLYLPWEFVLVLLIGSVKLPPKAWRMVVVGGLLAYTAACIYDYRDQGGLGALGKLSAVSFLFSAVFLVPLLFTGLVRTANSPDRSLFQDPYVWVLLALMAYFAGLVPCIAFFNYFLKHGNMHAVDSVITVVQVLFVLRSALTAVACWKLRNGLSPSPS
jgi:hypothetical protein